MHRFEISRGDDAIDIDKKALLDAFIGIINNYIAHLTKSATITVHRTQQNKEEKI